METPGGGLNHQDSEEILKIRNRKNLLHLRFLQLRNLFMLTSFASIYTIPIRKGKRTKHSHHRIAI